MAGNTEELEANYFAMCLLIPESLLNDDLESDEFAPPFDIESDKRIEELAKRYKVSAQLMTYRLIDMGKIKL